MRQGQKQLGHRGCARPRQVLLLVGARRSGQPCAEAASILLLHGNEFHQADVRVLRKKARAMLRKGSWYCTVQMRLPARLSLEGVEDAEGVSIDPEGIPSLGVRLLGHNLTAAVEEISHLLFFPGLGFNQSQQTKLKGHGGLLNKGLEAAGSSRVRSLRSGSDQNKGATRLVRGAPSWQRGHVGSVGTRAAFRLGHSPL